MNEGRTRSQRTLLLVGSLGPLGHVPASGTVTVAVVGVPLYWLMCDWTTTTYLVTTLALTAVSIWIHQTGDRILGEKDSRRLVWDELVGFAIAVAFIGRFTWQIATVAFFLERAIDIAKVPPANWIERRWPGGWGVVGDDVMAGLYTCAILQALIHWFPTLLGMSD